MRQQYSNCSVARPPHPSSCCIQEILHLSKIVNDHAIMSTGRRKPGLKTIFFLLFETDKAAHRIKLGSYMALDHVVVVKTQ